MLSKTQKANTMLNYPKFTATVEAGTHHTGVEVWFTTTYRDGVECAKSAVRRDTNKRKDVERNALTRCNTFYNAHVLAVQTAF